MLVRLLNDQLEDRLCEIKLQPEGLQIFDKTGTQAVLAVDEIRHFQTEGTGKTLKRFLLETKDNLYEGVFLEEGDADHLLRYLQATCRFYVEVQLDRK